MKNILVVGSTVVDLTFYTSHHPKVGETALGKFEQGLGGKGFNQAISASLTGSATRMLSAVGNDVFAQGFSKRLDDLKIFHVFERVSNEATGAAAITVDSEGRNSIVVALGANDKLSPTFLRKNEKFFDEISILLLQFETNLESIECAVELTKKKNPEALILLNPAPAKFRIPDQLFNKLDFITPNENELEILSGQGEINFDNLQEIQRACEIIAGDRVCVLATLGRRGCFFYNHGNKKFQETTEHIPAFAIKSVDTTGAGDAFHGAFASGLSHWPTDWKRAAVFASAAAALSITRPGTSASFSTRIEVEKFLETRNVR